MTFLTQFCSNQQMKNVLIIGSAVTLLGCIDRGTGQQEKLYNEKTGMETVFDTTQLVKTSKMLDENLYWNIINKSLKNTGGFDGQEQYLINEIKNLTPEEMIGFRLRTDKLLSDTYNSEMWCAGYIMNGGCSDDGFEYFRNWVISRGKETYYKAKENPDNLIIEADKHYDFYEFESFWYVALEAFKQKTGKEPYDYIDYDNFRTREGHYQQFKFTWDENDPESMKKICPRLFEKFRN